MELFTFLREERHVEEPAIEKLKDDGIDHSTLPYMKDEDLAKFLPRIGDRIAARNYCKISQNEQGESQKRSLFDRLRQKFRPDNREEKKGIGNKHAAKKDRIIELGWMDYDEESKVYKQVRSKSGGGTRLVRIDKSAKKDSIIALAKDRFFPGGISKKGPITQFSFSLCDFKQCEVTDNTVSELYELYSVRTLRFYLCSKMTEKISVTDDSDSDLPSLKRKPRRKRSRVQTNDKENTSVSSKGPRTASSTITCPEGKIPSLTTTSSVEETFTPSAVLSSIESPGSILSQAASVCAMSEEMTIVSPPSISSSGTHASTNTEANSSSNQDSTTICDPTASSVVQNISLSSRESQGSTVSQTSSFYAVSEDWTRDSLPATSCSGTLLFPTSCADASSGQDNVSLCDSNASSVVQYLSLSSVDATSPVNMLYRERTDLSVDPSFLETSLLDVSQNITLSYQDSDVSFGPRGDPRPSQMDVTLPLEQPRQQRETLNELQEASSRTISVRRGNVLMDLIKEFADESILDTEISVIRTLENGKREMGSGIGVLLDCLVEFWDEFYERCTTGLSEKIPYLRHDFREGQWQSCARIFLFGWAHFKYIPLLLSPHFVKSTINHQCSDLLIESFLKFINLDEREILKQALDKFEDVNLSELLDVLDRHSCKISPSSTNISKIVFELAHKELVQEPKFIIDSWKEILQPSPFANITPAELEELYNESIPTSRKIIQRLIINATNPSQNDSGNHLKRYLREADRPTLECFLRFCTGSNMLVHSNREITVEFQKMSEFERRPIGKTCSQTLQLGEDLPNYPEFRAEMNHVLKSNIWVFDYT